MGSTMYRCFGENENSCVKIKQKFKKIAFIQFENKLFRKRATQMFILFHYFFLLYPQMFSSLQNLSFFPRTRRAWDFFVHGRLLSKHTSSLILKLSHFLALYFVSHSAPWHQNILNVSFVGAKTSKVPKA